MPHSFPTRRSSDLRDLPDRCHVCASRGTSMINTTAIARALKANLAAQSIRIKHVQALDLIAAGIGLANRHVLATLPNLKPIQRVNIQLLPSAAPALALHAAATRQTIIVETNEL